MNKTTLPIAVICGLIAAVLFLSPMTMGGFGLFLSSFTALTALCRRLGIWNPGRHDQWCSISLLRGHLSWPDWGHFRSWCNHGASALDRP